MSMVYTLPERARESEMQMRIFELEYEVRKLNRYNKQFYPINKYMEDNNQANITNHFEGANIGKIVYNYGTINENNYGQNSSMPLTQTDKDIKETLESLLKEKDDKGKLLFRNKKQWWAVYRVLSTFCQQPKQMTSFKKIITDMEIDYDGNPNVITYDSLTDAPKTVPQLAASSPSAWGTYKEINDNYKQQYAVAEFLMLKLGIKS